MPLFVNKFFLIMAFIPIALILIDRINPNFIINMVKIKMNCVLNIKDKKKYFNSSLIINICELKNDSPFFLFNFSNNLEFIQYLDIPNKNISNIFENYSKNIGFEVFKIPNLKSSTNSSKFSFSLLSGNSLVVSFTNLSNNKYRIVYSIYKNFSSIKMCSNTDQMHNNIISNFLISCLEYMVNEIFCVYIAEQNPHGYLTQLNINHYSFKGSNLKLQSKEFLHAFNYQIKNIQLIKISPFLIFLIIYKENNQIESYMLKYLLEENKYLKKCKNLKEENKLNLTERRKAFKIFENGHKVYIEGHRGGFSEYQENSLLSFKEAIKRKIDSIELDVWLTKDNIPIVFHGYKKGILGIVYSNGKKKEEIYINNITLDYIKNVNSQNKRVEIPTLEEVLDICKNNIFINIELKDYQYELTFNIVTKIIESKNMFDQISLSSLRAKYIQLINDFNKKNKIKIECGYIFSSAIKIKNIKKAKGCSANVSVKQINEELIQEAHKNGIPVMAYFLKKNEENYKIYENLIKYGVDVICSNNPSKALEYRNKYYFSKFNISN